ncbi:hypothetical protein K449DRAFT_383480 [Hypoxylon sp. EC38]|nr:hypothetical protein K449DRAFT_383480 [Hypoxylon sp. EC38]
MAVNRVALILGAGVSSIETSLPPLFGISSRLLVPGRAYRLWMSFLEEQSLTSPLKPRIGASVAEKFASDGYKVAVASRSGNGTKSIQGVLSLKADFAKPDSIPALFDAVKTEFKAFPNVVVYNAATLTNPPDKDSVLSIPTENVVSDLNVNTVSPYVTAQQAIRGWQTLPKETKKTFIYTGNILNVSVVPVPQFLDLGMGKAASAYWIGVADASYTAQGFRQVSQRSAPYVPFLICPFSRFFYADQRQADGQIIGAALDAPAHGEFYAQLANHEGNVPWHATFVKGKGYVQFK